MKKESIYFDVYPKVLKADENASVTVADRYRQGFLKDGGEYEARVYPLEGRGSRGGDTLRAVTAKAAQGALRFEHFFAGEQEHLLDIREKGDHSQGLRFRVYSLEGDLFSRKPFLGDMHMHTRRSDGKESPGFLAARCRQIGLDFIAITDHGQYEPSVEAQEAYRGAGLDMLICRGEEIHPPDNPVHMVNFGGDSSINERIRENPSGYRKEVSEYEKELRGVPDAGARYQIASCKWCFDRIREGGGLGIFCHPYWLVEDGYDVSGAVTSHLIDAQPFDALEVIGGFRKYEEESNTLQVARYHEERAKGKRIPLVGVSDSHGSLEEELFGWYYTVVFSPALEQKQLIESIKALYSVAVEAIPGEAVRAYGPFRLVKYAQFLLREVLPQHNALCFEEGSAMLAHLAGEAGAAERLRALKGRVAELYRKLWTE